MTTWIDADKVAEYLQPGMTVFVAGATAEPGLLLDALRNNPACCAGIRFVSVSVPGINKVDFAAFHEDCRSTAFFATPDNRDAIAAGRVDFVPLQYRSIFDYLAGEISFDLVLAQLPAPDNNGRFSLGVCADFLPAVLDNAKLLIGEINRQQPRAADSPTWPLSRLDVAVECDRPVATVTEASIDQAAIDIGRHVAELIRDGDCLQIGIGGVPNAILAALNDRNDLGIHSGLVSDGVMALASTGNINGKNKSVDTGRIVTGTTLGSSQLIDWAGNNAKLSFRPVSYTHDVGVIRQLDNFVSINSALEVDLFGQVNADMLHGRQQSGTGGSIDMMRAAALSRGGRSIIALKATAAGGSRSRIVATLSHDTAATILRTDVDYVVTEYGTRRIRHLSTIARADALAEIAAPQYRDSVRDDWTRLSLHRN
ncbi:MAG: acetyl-CoA hydrolase/transferase family protein [Proteobacteria bacterium]|nr:acetyl-CoA hydrolase/transferase family protein [Pseudomonadota bacterium]